MIAANRRADLLYRVQPVKRSELSFPTVFVLNKITPKYYKMVQILRLNMGNYMRAH